MDADWTCPSCTTLNREPCVEPRRLNYAECSLCGVEFALSAELVVTVLSVVEKEQPCSS